MKNKLKNPTYIILFSFIMLLMFVSGFKLISHKSASSEKTTEITNRYPVINPVIADTSYTVSYIATLQSVRYVELKSKVSGYMETLYVDEGQKVKKGQVLFSIGSQEYEMNLRKANSVLKSAQADMEVAAVDLKNARKLVESNIISGTELEQAQAKYDALEARVDESRSECENAKMMLSFTIIKAPFDGMIGQILNKPGSLIEEGTLLTTISDNSGTYAYFNLSEQEYLSLINDNDNLRAQKVRLLLANNQVFSHLGIIETTDNKINSETGNITFRAYFDNPENILKHNASGKILISKRIKNAIIIPQKATFDIQNRKYVYFVNDYNIITRQSINPKYILSNLYVLDAGLKSSDRILYDGIQNVHEGDKINYEIVSFTSEKGTGEYAKVN